MGEEAGAQVEELGGEQVWGRVTGTLVEMSQSQHGPQLRRTAPSPGPKGSRVRGPSQVRRRVNPQASQTAGGCLPAGPGSSLEMDHGLSAEAGEPEGRLWGRPGPRRGEERPDLSLGGHTRHAFPDPGPPQQAEVRFKILQAKMPTSEDQRCPGLARRPVRAPFPSRPGAGGSTRAPEL